MLLNDDNIDTWNPIITKPTTPYYRFYVNGVRRHVPVHNGTHFFTSFALNMLSESDFNVSGQNPIKIEKTDDPTIRGIPFNFSVTYTVSSYISSTPPIRDTTSISWAICSLLLFIPTAFLFMLNKAKFVSVPLLTDARTLPDFHANLNFFTCAGLIEYLRLWLFAIFSNVSSRSTFASLGLLATFPIAALHASFVRKTGYYLNEIDLGMYSILGLIVLGVMPDGIAFISRLLFDSFRGPTLAQFFVLNCLCGWSLILTARLGARMALIAVTKRQPWFTDNPVKKSSDTGFFYIAGYAAVVGLLLHPLVVHLVDWVFEDAPLDFNWLLTLVTIYCAFAAFFGLMRTFHRLSAGRGVWTDDHILLHAIPGVAIAGDVVIRAFAVKNLGLDDAIGMAFCGAAALTLLTAVVAFGSTASFVSSFSFVYVAIISGHAGDPAT
jgi:hypothetical protein